MQKYLFFIFLISQGLAFAQNKVYSHSDSIKGSITSEREWFNVIHYDLHSSFDSSDSSILGYNKITYLVLKPKQIMQIDLMSPMILDSIIQNDKLCSWKKDGNAYFIHLIVPQKSGEKQFITCYFHGKPQVAKLPPWDGGMVWKKDKNLDPWISIACQGLAGSVWFPNKDHVYDEPDSMNFFITVPKNLIAVSNGRLISVTENTSSVKTFHWEVKNPINNYNIIPYIGKYVNYTDTFMGEGGKLDLNYWVLDYNLEKARQQFVQVKSMLRCFEMWFGKYPFYEDGYKLVESPYLGMEHQSAIAYGNGFANGYKGRDLSLTGWGLKWDFIIIHESGHEWFGNNISAQDVADNWIHESFTTYSENLYTEFLYGKKAGAEYVIGTRKLIKNDIPVIGKYAVNSQGSTDMYYKGANMLHSIRQIVNNDSIWRCFLRDINKTFWHQTVTTKQIEIYMSEYFKIDLKYLFNQYLREIQIPVFEYKMKKNVLIYRWTNCVPNFNMPVRIFSGNTEYWLKPNESFQKIKLKSNQLKIDENFLITPMQIK